MKKTTRILIAEDSLRIIKQGHYVKPQGKTVSTHEDQQRSVKSTIHYTEPMLDAVPAKLAGLQEGKFKNRFERIVFAIKSNEERFIEPFRRHFA